MVSINLQFNRLVISRRDARMRKKEDNSNRQRTKRSTRMNMEDESVFFICRVSTEYWFLLCVMSSMTVFTDELR